MSFDTIIIGAGPAGSFLARILAVNGLKVLITDKETFPREKVCGELLTEKTAKIVCKYFPNISTNKIFKSHSTDAAIYSYTNKLIDICGHYSTYYINRKDFDNNLVSSAVKSGAIFRDNNKAVDIEENNNIVRFQNGDSEKADTIVGADGPFSLSSRIVLGKIKDYKSNTAIGISAKIPKELFISSYLDDNYFMRPNIYFGFINWGYSWVFPNEQYLNVGIAGKISKNTDFKSKFTTFLKTLPLTSLNSVKFKSSPVPYGKNHLRSGKNRFLLIGDAAGLVDPVTGEGIYYAAKSAELASKVILANHSNKILSKSYKKLLFNEIILQIYQGYFARYLLYGKNIHKHALNRIKSNKNWSDGFMHILSGQIDYFTLFKNIILKNFDNE